jgi:general secretion pathway protein L
MAAKKLLIRFTPVTPGADPSLVSWLTLGGGDAGIQRGSLDEVAAQAIGAQVIVLVPGIDVLLLTAQVPTQNRQRILKAVPFLLEDQLASDVDDLHFAVGDGAPSGHVPCAVVARDRMTEWVNRLREFNLQPDVIVADYLALPIEPASWTLYKDADGVLVRIGPQSGFFVELDNLLPMLEIALSEAGEQRPARLRVLDADTGTEMPDLNPLNVEFSHEPFDAQSFLTLAQNVERNTALNLLQGSYSRREQIGKMWRPWRPAAALAAVFVLLHLSLSAVDLIRDKRRVEELRAEVEQVYLATFPNEKRVPNPRAQMEQHLRELRGEKGSGGSTGFLGLVGSAANTFKNTPGLELRSLRYKDGKLDVDFTVRDLQVLDQLKQSLTQQAAVDVDIQSANARADVVEGRMQLRSRGS